MSIDKFRSFSPALFIHLRIFGIQNSARRENLLSDGSFFDLIAHSRWAISWNIDNELQFDVEARKKCDKLWRY